MKQLDISQIYLKFPTKNDCIAVLEEVLWNKKPKCPYCQSYNSTPMSTQHRHHCNNCNTSYSVTVNTIFHQTHLPMQKWFYAIILILNARLKITTRQLSYLVDVNKNTACRITQQILSAIRQPQQRGLILGLMDRLDTYDRN
ncbi:MAG TPA: IS1595 family transposase [bacterium]|nr:IS1595 family transposase [bacterium]